MRLMVYSKSTEKYINKFKFDDKFLVTHHPDSTILDLRNTVDKSIAIGGGSVIDVAKIMTKDKIIAIPTTYSGASETTHAVYWDKEKKHDIKTKKPISILIRDWINLPKDLEAATKIDCLCHITEALISPKGTNKSTKNCLLAINMIKKNDWLKASIYAGRAIEITGTNIIHSLSYPLTVTNIKYMPHGLSLAKIIEMAKEYNKFEGLL